MITPGVSGVESVLILFLPKVMLIIRVVATLNLASDISEVG